MRKTLTKALISIVAIVMLGLLTCNTIQISTTSNLQKKLLEQIEKPVSSTVIINKDDEILEAINKMASELDDANKSAEKECEVKALQTLIYIFSCEVIPRGKGGEFKFDYLSDKAYEYYLKQHAIYKEKRLYIANVNGTHYDAKKNKIFVGIWYAPENSDVRTQYEFTFIKVSNEWIIDDIGLDS